VLLLAILSQLLVRHTLLDYLPGEPRDLRVSKLKCGTLLLQRGVLPLELALCLLLSRALVLEGVLSLLEGGLLLLEPTLRLLTRALLLAKLLLHRNERSGLLRQVSPPPLSLLSLLLGLGLPGPAPSRVARSC
jgi:hypothetical protein